MPKERPNKQNTPGEEKKEGYIIVQLLPKGMGQGIGRRSCRTLSGTAYLLPIKKSISPGLP